MSMQEERQLGRVAHQMLCDEQPGGCVLERLANLETALIDLREEFVASQKAPTVSPPDAREPSQDQLRRSEALCDLGLPWKLHGPRDPGSTMLNDPPPHIIHVATGDKEALDCQSRRQIEDRLWECYNRLEEVVRERDDLRRAHNGLRRAHKRLALRLEEAREALHEEAVLDAIYGHIGEQVAEQFVDTTAAPAETKAGATPTEIGPLASTAWRCWQVDAKQKGTDE